MNNSNITKWQRRIEKTFHGKLGIVGERLLKLESNEKLLAKKLTARFSGYVCLMDAFLDFYLETLQLLNSRKSSEWTKMQAVITGIHVPTFWRFRASYLIFLDGYLIDAASLLRAIFENTLQIVALKLEIISIDEVFGKLKVEKSQNLNDKEIYKLIRDYTIKSDNKVRAQLIGEESGLSSTAIDDLKVFVNLLHSFVHKSKFNIVRYYGPWVRGEHPLPLYPVYDEDHATLYINFSMFIGWMLSKTFSLLQINNKEFSNKWHIKYRTLDKSFKEAVAGFPKRLGRSIEELVTKKFDFVL